MPTSATNKQMWGVLTVANPARKPRPAQTAAGTKKKKKTQPRPAQNSRPAQPAPATVWGPKFRSRLNKLFKTRATIGGVAASVSGPDMRHYMATVLNPVDSPPGAKWPDDSLQPTCATKLVSSSTYTIGASQQFFAAQGWKLLTYAGASRANSNLRDFTGGTAVGPSYTACLIPPQDPTFPTTGSFVAADYGGEQTTYATLCAEDRTIACGMRIKLRGLPSNTLFPPGVVYLVQVAAHEFLTAQQNINNEQWYIQAVNAGKGYMLNMAEIYSADGITRPFLPLGPNSFAFSGVDGARASALSSSDATQLYIKSEPVEPNGALVAVGFGITTGVTVHVTFAHHSEFVPTVAAAGILQPEVCAPDTASREVAQRAVAVVNESVGGASSVHVLRKNGLTGDEAATIGKVVGGVAGGLAGQFLFPGVGGRSGAYAGSEFGGALARLIQDRV